MLMPTCMAMEGRIRTLLNFFSDWKPYFELCVEETPSVVRLISVCTEMSSSPKVRSREYSNHHESDRMMAIVKKFTMVGVATELVFHNQSGKLSRFFYPNEHSEIIV